MLTDRSRTSAARLIEACLSARATRSLLYAGNLSADFFDLSSGLAAETIEKLQRFRIR